MVAHAENCARGAIAAWTTAKKNQRPWLRQREDRLELNLAVPAENVPAFASLTRELVDYRLAQYRRRVQSTADEGFLCALTWNQRDPILKLPGRKTQALPEGETDVRLPDGSIWQFRFMKEFINVARPPGAPNNRMPDLLRGWFGPRAGQPGTAFQVRFYRSPDGLWIEPIRAAVIALAPRRGVIAYPDLRAAAGHAQGATDALESDRVLLPVEDDDPDLFAVRVAGTSMDGGAAPLRDGDWALMQLARGAPADALANRVVLVQVPAESAGMQYQIKRLIKDAGRWVLASDNPDGPRIEPGEEATVIARLRRGIQPEELAPAVGTMLSGGELGAAFGVEELEAASGRHGGHLFLFVDRAGILEAPDRVRFAVERRRPSETAFVLAKLGERYRYLGVGRWQEESAVWRVPEVDFATWRAWGTGKEVSRVLPDGYLLRAQAAADALLALPERERVVDQSDDRRARVLGRAPRGGLRIDGGPGGFAERTVSLGDIAWVAVAEDDVRAQGGLLDEQRVDRLRYLEGTPKGSTRWIDTGWALAVWAKALPLIPAVEASALVKLRRDDGTELDASFRVHKVGAQVSVIVEARGGTVGSAEARNTQYTEGLELLLQRLKAHGARIVDAVVESRETAELAAEEERRIHGPSLQYPLSIGDPRQLARDLQGAQARVGRAPGARGSGNRTRRIRIVVEGLPGAWTASQAAAACSAERSAALGA